MAVLVFIFTILILVVIHELGHFFMAKKFNIKVLEFGFGIPPRAWGKKVGETLVSINWLPFGGFVRLLGEDEEDPKVLDHKRSFANQAVWKRITVVVAGVVMNLLLAWFLFYISLGIQGFKTQIPLIEPYQFAGVTQTNESMILIQAVSKGSPADLAGIKSGDRVLALNTTPIKSSEDLISQTKANQGKEIKLTISDQDGSHSREVAVTPRLNPPAGQGPLGVALGSEEWANLEYKTPIQRIFSGPVQSYNIAAYSLSILGKTISLSYQTHNIAPVSATVAGPVGITSIVGDIITTPQAFQHYLDFLAALSLNLAVVNVLPFPGLDGGRLIFLIFEAITKKRPHPVVEKYVHTIGLAVLIGLILLVTLSDVKKLF